MACFIHTEERVAHTHLSQWSVAVHLLLEEQRGVSFVVAADQLVGVIHAGAVDSKPAADDKRERESGVSLKNKSAENDEKQEHLGGTEQNLWQTHIQRVLGLYLEPGDCQVSFISHLLDHPDRLIVQVRHLQEDHLRVDVGGIPVVKGHSQFSEKEYCPYL